MLKERGYCDIKVGDEVISLRFCTWSLKRFCETNGNLTFSQLLEKLSGSLSLTDITNLLLCAAEYQYVKEKKPFPFTDLDASDWIDEMGGINGAAFLKVLNVAVSSIAGNLEESGEKKRVKK